MSAVPTVARKELRALFQSPVALIFLGVFLATTLFTFFSASAFFARNLADVRPLFEWLPVLLIGLVSAVTMRSWAEERKAGTLEVLLTLPVSTLDLVLGKFAAGLALVAIALLLTTPIPALVSTLGPLDWGPVTGGYVGALLLGAAYLAIGLAVSARTDNQIVALMVTLVIGGLLYLVGTETVAGLLDNRGVALVSALGTGSRFESIERGVLDLRDLVYYASLTVFFLALNVVSLEDDRLDPGSEPGRARRAALWTGVALVGLNAVLANLWLAPIATARLDLTAHGEYSISPVTRRVLGDLQEPLAIHGYFSERTHPKLAPLVPRIRDLIVEYGVAGGDRVEVGFFDPASDEALEQEIGERYAIRSFPFGVTDRHSQAVVNSFFHVLVRYGDEYEVLSFQDLIEVGQKPDGDVDVRLRNLEYDLTKSIRRVSQDFQTLDSLLARLPEPATFTIYETPALIPPDFQSTSEALKGAAAEVAERSGGKVHVQVVDPSGDAALQQKIFDEYGVRPLAVDLFGEAEFYLHLVLDFGDTVERVLPRGELSKVEVVQALEAAVKRATPGQLKTIGVYTELPEAPPQDPRMPPQFQPPAQDPDYRAMQQLLAEEAQVRSLTLEDGHVPDAIDVLVAAKPGELAPTKQYAIDQFLMRGGALVVLAGSHRVQPGRGGLVAQPEGPGLSELLLQWGVALGPSLVMDPKNAPFPVPVTEQRGSFRVQRVELLPYPMFPDIRRDGLADHPVLSGISGLTAPWASPLSLADPAPDGVQAVVLARSSAESWLNESASLNPDFSRWPEAGFGPTGPVGPQPVAVALTGRFTSYFAGKGSPGFPRPDGRGRSLESSVADGKLVVVGSSEFLSDLVFGLSQQPSGEVHRANLQLVQNAIDWATEDTDLLEIRTGGAFARTLEPMEEGDRTAAEWTVYGLVGLPFLLVIVVPRLRRTEPIPVAGGDR